MTEDWYLAYRHTDGREIRLKLTGFGFSTKTEQELSMDEEYQSISRALQRLAKRVMK